jgi:hypothetical protein
LNHIKNKKLKTMATRSYIGTKNTDGTVTYIYCHWDGYPSGVGKTLAEHYTTPTKIEELMKVGDLSVLDESIGDRQDFSQRIMGTCLAYGRDRGDSNTSAKTRLFENIIKDQNVDYIYVFDGDYWECYDTENPSRIISLYNQSDTVEKV